MTAKTAFFEIILNVHTTKREIADEKLKHINFATWAVSKIHKLKFWFNLRPVSQWTNEFLLIPSFHQLGWKAKFWASKLRYFEMFRKKMTIELKNVIPNRQKNQRRSELFRKKSVLKQRCLVLILLLWRLIFQRWSQLNQWCSEISGNVQRWIRTETSLVSADNFWIRGSQRWNPLRPQHGMPWSGKDFSNWRAIN